MEVEQTNKWRAGAGTTALGIIGTALGGLALSGNNGGGLLGGLGGNGGNAITSAAQKENNELRSEVARLRSEKYTDSHILDVAKQLAAVDEHLHAVDQQLEKSIVQNAADIACAKEINARDLEIAKQQAKIDSLQMESKINARIDAVAVAANSGIQANAVAIESNAGAIRCLQHTVNGITHTVVPHSAVCNVNKPACCCPQAEQ